MLQCLVLTVDRPLPEGVADLLFLCNHEASGSEMSPPNTAYGVGTVLALAYERLMDGTVVATQAGINLLLRDHLAAVYNAEPQDRLAATRQFKDDLERLSCRSTGVGPGKGAPGGRIAGEVRAMAQCRSPGLDGLPVQYSVARRLLGCWCPLTRDSSEVQAQRFSTALREAQIVMLPKPDRAPMDLSSCRPLSMGVDTKVLAKATRLGRDVTHLVLENQCGFMPSRETR
ncbi:hypothetical protein NDU88_003038 [Pleurodeles waltl]|uniref:Reverse transcriptase domain-containing protein n=1 Tax=Pleurodeles waltl TaxID=8319 RepID=A0AAV7M5Y5_PLEWA|nr:hypothetical protein NDU88_003038 [Pleurodeles waltl]